MAIPSRQIGWSTQSNLLWQISKRLELLIKVMGANNTTTTTTTTSISSNALKLTFNNFNNLVSSELSNQPLFLNTCANDYKYINPKTINYYKRDIDRSRIKSKQSKIRLINDMYSNYLFSFNFSQTNQNKSYR